MNCLTYRLWLLHRCYRSTIQHLLFMNTGQMHLGKDDKAIVFFAIISYGASRFFATNFLLHSPCNIIYFALSQKQVSFRFCHFIQYMRIYVQCKIYYIKWPVEMKTYCKTNLHDPYEIIANMSNNHYSFPKKASSRATDV